MSAARKKFMTGLKGNVSGRSRDNLAKMLKNIRNAGNKPAARIMSVRSKTQHFKAVRRFKGA